MALDDVIEKNRRELLDLSARNRLVHTPLEGKRKSWLSIVEERSDQLFDLLARQGKVLSFAARPDAEADDEEEHERFLQVFDESSDNSTETDEPLEQSESPAGPEARHTDTILQTRLEKEALQSQLLRMLYDARTAEEEQGVSILYLACGFLKWREAGASDVYRYAPLLLIPVDLSRNSARSQFRLKFREEDIATNLSIQARLLQDFGIRVPDIPEDAIDNKDWTPLAYFQEVKERIAAQTGWDVLEHEILLWFFSFTKFLMYRDLSPASWPKEADLCQNPLIQALLVNGFGEIESLPPLVDEDEPIDNVLSPADVIHVTDADSSQAIVIEEIAQGRNLVVQGPPGTGKSQTITNAIAAAVHAGKRVLFIAEKMAALEVVKRRLDEIGLGPMTLELHSHKARKREVLEELKDTLELGNPKGTRNVPIEELRTKARHLREYDRLLHSPIGASGCSPYQAMGQLLKLKNAGKHATKELVPQFTDWTPEEYESRKQVALELDRLLKVSGSPLDHPWRGARCAPLTPTDLERFAARLKVAKEHLRELEVSNTDLADKLGMPQPRALRDAKNLNALAEHILRCPPSCDRKALAHDRWQTDVPGLEQALGNLKQLIEERDALAERVNEAAWNTDLSATRIALAAHAKRWFRIFNSSFRQAVATLRGICKGPAPKDADERVQLVDRIQSVQTRRKRLQQDEEFGRSLLGSLWAGEATSVREAEAIVDWVKAGEKSEFVKANQRHVAERLKDSQIIATPLSKAASQVERAENELKAIARDLKLDLAAAFGCDDFQQVGLEAWADRISNWISSTEDLSHYLATDARLVKLRDLGLTALASEIDQGQINAGEVADQLEMLRSEAVLNRAWQERPMLAEFHGEAFEGDAARFAELDLERIALSRLEVAKAHYDNLPRRTADTGQVKVLRHEMGKQRRHMPIRRLLSEAGHAIQKIKPVFMMSPLSVAQFLEPGVLEFDLLVIDEASQVQPVDALGAIARSKQIVVVGDQKQLPPTSFFARLSGEGEETDEEATDESLNAGDVESILGLCEAQGLPNRMLRWHYRSRHESLIAVSNRQFYNDRLFIVPSPMIAGGPLGLKFRYVANGCYDRGGSRTNRNEAIAVAEAVMQHAREHPNLSLGVATFSTAQRDAILDEIELRRRVDPLAEEFFMNNGHEPFFVKSLENVQGDQRDVIFISVGYAKDQGGYFAQNFGPLNRKGGERRLNVLISRAASACEVFSSIKADDIDLSRTQSIGVTALKLYLNYAEHGRMDAVQSLGDADSVFEEQVALAIRDKGFEVDHQIGVGGFFVDLAVRDPNRPGRYLLGIECDGAQYHSARWVRDRDRLRQQILESRGWQIHRVWSTDWFKRPIAELDRVLKALDDAKSHWESIDRKDAESSALLPVRNGLADADAVWERDEPGNSESEVQNGEPENPYREAESNSKNNHGSLSDMPQGKLTRLIKAIIQIEAPIHLEELCRRCVKLMGATRLGANQRLKLESAIKRLAKRGELVQKEQFIHRPNMEKYPVRNRRSLENANLRKIEYIPPEELREAILTVVTGHVAPSEVETASSVAKLLGINNTPTVQNVVKEQIALLTAENTLAERAGKLFAS